MIIANQSLMLTPSTIKKYIDSNAAAQANFTKLYNYYIGQQDILNRYITDISKPCNKLVTNFCEYITSFASGYFMGEGVTYTNADEIIPIMQYNDEEFENIQLAIDSSIYGIATELIYIDSNKDIRFKRVNPADCILIYDDTIENELLYVIRYYNQIDIATDEKIYYTEVYSKYDISYYIGETPSLVEQVTHMFGLVPFAVYYNSSTQQGDFECILSLQDAYNKLDSFSIDDVEAFSDCYMVLKGVDGTDGDAISEMKTNKVLLLPTDATAEYLTKSINDGYLENLKTRITNNIHKISKVPEITNETFGTQSGIAMRYKLIGLESKVAQKERMFKLGLQRRLELIFKYNSALGTNGDYKSIDITFSRALPESDNDSTEIVTALQGIVSNETLLNQLSFVEDPLEEIKKVNAEKQSNISDNNTGIITQ